MLDLSKPVQTRNGLKVRIVCTDANSGFYPVIALISVGNHERCISYTKEGKRYENCVTADDDLINVPQPRPHADVIKAWADGAEVQCRYSETDNWETLDFPMFDPCAYYRVKP